MRFDAESGANFNTEFLSFRRRNGTPLRESMLFSDSRTGGPVVPRNDKIGLGH